MQDLLRPGARELLSNWLTLEGGESPLLRGTGLAWPSSRLQKLHRPNLWMKRDDEMSFQISGPKFRKLVGLHKALSATPRVVSFGSARSAFLLGLAQLSRESRFSLELFLLKSTPYQEFGTDRLYENAFAGLTVHWLSREEWLSVAAISAQRAEELDAILLPEGGASPLTLPGSLSLSLDLVSQYALGSPQWDEIWIDAGSGFTAQSLILGLGMLMLNPPCVNVVLCAGDAEIFERGLLDLHKVIEARFGIDFQPAPFVCRRPPTAVSYGATNAAVWETIARYHQTEGVLLDPLYTAKLMMSCEQERVDDSRLTLVIHSGGGLNNFGFLKGLRVHRP